jgi:hypothetical protein
MSKPKSAVIAVSFAAAIALLSGTAFCDVSSVKDTTITAEIVPSISITAPDMSARWIINPGIVNTITKDLIVSADADWEVGVKGPNGANMKAVGIGRNYTLHNYLQIAAANVTPFKLPTTNNFFLKQTARCSNKRFPITFQQQGSFEDTIEENGTPLVYSIIVTFTGRLS